MNTLLFLDEIKTRCQLATDAQLANVLDCSTAQISQYRTKKRVMDDYMAARVAELLEIDELEVIAQANAERERDEVRRAYWQHKAEAARQRSGRPLEFWRARDDSNVRPLPSEGSTLSN